jgi:alpha-mannosidase
MRHAKFTPRCWWAFLGFSLFTAPVLAAASVGQVIVVFKTHFDIGYTDLASNVVRRYQTTMIDQALEVCDRNRELPPAQQFTWTLPGWPMHKILEDWPGQTPARQERVRQACQQGRFVTHALPFTTHTELLEVEDLVRGLGYSTRLARAMNLPLPRDAKMTDVPCHTWFVPTLLKNAGVDFLHLGCNAASRSPQIPVLFWWEGPDGSRLLTMYTAESYGTGLVPPEGWPHRTWLALIHTGDNHGPPTTNEVSGLLADAQKKLPGVTVRIGRLSDFADAIRAEKASLPIVRGDMPDTWIHGPMCDPRGAQFARTTRPLINATETLNTLLRGWGLPVAPVTATVADAYEQSLLYGEHTWGGALYWVSSYSSNKTYAYGPEWQALRAAGKFARLEASWNEHTHYIETAQQAIQPLLHQQLATLAQSVRRSGKRIVVFNPLPWTRDSLVDLPGDWPSMDPPVARMVDVRCVETRARMPLEPNHAHGRFLARDLPAFGYQTYEPIFSYNASNINSGDNREVPRDGTAKPLLVETRYFTMVVDPVAGRVVSLFDKRASREWTDPASPQGLGQFLYERFDRDQVAAYVKAYVKINTAWATNELGKPNLPPASQEPYRAASPQHSRVTLRRTPVGTTVTLSALPGAAIPFAVTTQWTLYQDLPCVDLTVEVAGKPADPWPEAGWICLPFKLEAPRFRVGRQNSIVDPARDIVPGANRHLMAVNSGLNLADRTGYGVGICPVDDPLVSLDTPGCWKYSMDFVPQKPVVFVNLFNNQWTTNFRLWNEGTWRSRVRLWPIHGSDHARNLIQPAWEARLPALAAYADGPAGPLPVNTAGIELSRPGVLVTAFGPNPDGAGWVLRLWEQSGNAGSCRVRLGEPWSMAKVQPCDLRGQPAGPGFQSVNRSWTAALHSFAPASFLLMPAEPQHR